MRKWLALVLLIALFVRMQNFNAVLSSPVLPLGYDPYYHMRLVEVIVNSGFRPDFDYYLNYPFGLKIGWLPLFSYILAVPGVISFGAVEIFAAFLPVILGVISTLLVYLIANKIFDNEYFAILSALFFSLTPAVVNVSTLGFVDHHIWNIALLLAAAYFTLYEDYRSLLAGVFLALLSFSWLGSPIYAAVLALSLFVFKDEKDLRLSAVAFAIPAVSFVVNPFIGLSYLAIAAFLILGIYVKKKGYEAYYIAACVAAIAAVYLIPVGQLSMLKSGINYIFGKSIYLPTIAEAQSFELSGIIGNSGYFAFLLAIPAFVLLKNRFVGMWFVSSFALALLQIRFTTLLAIAVSILAAYTVLLVLDRSGYPIMSGKSGKSGKVEESGEVRGNRKKKNEKRAKGKGKTRGEELKKGDIAFAILFVAIIVSPSIVLSVRPFDMSDDWREALMWMKENTEPTSYYLQPDKKPEYSVLSWWDYGNWIVYVAKRPVVCNNFQAGAVDAAKFFTAQSESDAMKIVKKRGVKYILTDEEMKLGNETEKGKFEAIMRIAGINPDLMDDVEMLEFYNSTMFYKLHFENAEGLKNFRLVKNFGRVKIFEVTP
jgi:dolichyl-diphosphooligosaccharide--protein glycosyltransferase